MLYPTPADTAVGVDRHSYAHVSFKIVFLRARTSSWSRTIPRNIQSTISSALPRIAKDVGRGSDNLDNHGETGRKNFPERTLQVWVQITLHHEAQIARLNTQFQGLCKVTSDLDSGDCSGLLLSAATIQASYMSHRLLTPSLLVRGIHLAGGHLGQPDPDLQVQVLSLLPNQKPFRTTWSTQERGRLSF